MELDRFNIVFEMTKSKEVMSHLRRMIKENNKLVQQILKLSKAEDDESKERLKQLKEEKRNLGLLTSATRSHLSLLKDRDRISTKNIQTYNKAVKEAIRLEEKRRNANYKEYKKTQSLEAKQKRQESGARIVASRLAGKERGTLRAMKIAQQRKYQEAENTAVPVLATLGFLKSQEDKREADRKRAVREDAKAIVWEEKEKEKILKIERKTAETRKKEEAKARKERFNYEQWWKRALEKRDAQEKREADRKKKAALMEENASNLAFLSKLGKFVAVLKGISYMAGLVPGIAKNNQQALLNKARRINMLASSGMSKAKAASLGVNLAAYGGSTNEALAFASGITGQIGAMRYGDASLVSALGQFGVTGIGAFSRTEDVIRKIAQRAQGMDVYAQEAMFNAANLPLSMRAAIRSGDENLMRLSAKPTTELTEEEKAQLRQLEIADNSMLELLALIADMLYPISKVFNWTLDKARGLLSWYNSPYNPNDPKNPANRPALMGSFGAPPVNYGDAYKYKGWLERWFDTPIKMEKIGTVPSEDITKYINTTTDNSVNTTNNITYYGSAGGYLSGVIDLEAIEVGEGGVQ